MKLRRFGSAAVAALVFIAGVGVMLVLFSFREPPAEAAPDVTERSLRVDVARLESRDIAVTLRGHGTVRSSRSVDLSAQVSGTVLEVHPNLVIGGLIREGEVLFAVDHRRYAAEAAEARAHVAELDATAARLRTEYENDQRRSRTLERTRDLAKAEFDRAKELLGQAIGNRTDVSTREQALNGASDELDLLKRQLAVYPLRIREAEENKAASMARLELANIQAEGAQARSPFDARVVEAKVEVGQYVLPGATLVRLADDSTLEIPVKLDAREARRWLQFKDAPAAAASAWFSEPVHVSCTIRWTEEENGHYWTGTLERIESFDAESRTVTATVSIPAKGALSCDRDGAPLVAGMFCEVTVPGRALESAYALPQSAVTVDDTIHVARDNRLKTLPVDVIRVEGANVYVSGDLSPGEMVVTTRLLAPLENSLLEIANASGEQNAATE